MKAKRFLAVLAIAGAGLIAGGGCDFPYEPTRAQQPSQQVSVGHLKNINGENQVCNPSVSQNEHLNGCLLFLNLSTMSVHVPANFAAEFDTVHIIQHDRLSAVDTSNTVRWFMMQPGFVLNEMQDPEWSTHPDYIAFLGGDEYSTENAFAVRVSDKKVLKLNQKMVQDNSTPHFWLPDPPATPTPATTGPAVLWSPTNPAVYDADGMVDTATIREYFGTDSVKVVFSKNRPLDIYYIDYSLPSPALTKLLRPDGRDGWTCESPLISHDGNWITFNCINDRTAVNECWVQKLSPTSKPILVSTNAGEPHWWFYSNGDAAIIYATKKPGPIADLFDEKKIDGTIGSTMLQRIDLATIKEGLPAALNFSSDPKTLLGLPFQGGLSRDGRFLVTGYQPAYIYVF